MIIDIALGILLAIFLFWVAVGLIAWMVNSPGSFFGLFLGVPILLFILATAA